MSTDDDRAVAASRVDEVPSDANVVSSQHEAIRDIEPIQIAISSALEDDEKTEWLRSTLTRERDMDEVSEALEQLPEYHGEDGQRQYYVQDEETEQSLVVIFGIPEQSE